MEKHVGGSGNNAVDKIVVRIDVLYVVAESPHQSAQLVVNENLIT